MFFSSCVNLCVFGVCILAVSSSCSEHEEENLIKINLPNQGYAANPSEPQLYNIDLPGLTNEKINQQVLPRGKSKDCVCGKVSENKRIQNSRQHIKIVNGTNINEKHHPFLALLRVGNKYHDFMCGGSIINLNYVLTAAHCLENVSSPSDIQVLLGVHSWDIRKNHQTYQVTDILMHPGYVPGIKPPNGNDIALLRLDRRIKINDYVRPICLPETDTNMYSAASAQGWGQTCWECGAAVTPQEAKMRVMSTKKCHNYVNGTDDPSTHICALGYYDYSGVCRGDSGGPLIVETQNKFRILIGVTSRGLDKCDKYRRIPDIYTRVESYLDWIAKNTKDAEYCSYPNNL